MYSKRLYNEKELIAQIKIHNRTAFDELYTRYYPKLRSYVFTFVKISTFGEDIVQDAFVKVWEIRENLDPDKYFAGYLFTITKNLILKFLKDTSRNTELVEEVIISLIAENENSDTSLEYEELQKGIKEAINQLPPRRKEIFLLCREDNLSYMEVSARLGLSRNTIKEHMVLAMRSIKDYLMSRSLYQPAYLLLLFL